MAKIKAVILETIEQVLIPKEPIEQPIPEKVADLPTPEEASKATMAHTNLNPILKMAIAQAAERKAKDQAHGME